MLRPWEAGPRTRKMAFSIYLLQAQEQQLCLFNWGFTWGSCHQEINYLYFFYLLVPNCSLSYNETCGHTPHEECWQWGQCCLKEQGQNNISTWIPWIELVWKRWVGARDNQCQAHWACFYVAAICHWTWDEILFALCLHMFRPDRTWISYSAISTHHHLLMWLFMVNHKGQHSIN